MALDDEMVRILVAYGSLIRVRQAWYALPDTHADILRACEIGGRLACGSALRLHGEHVADDGVLHVEVPANAVIHARLDGLAAFDAQRNVRLHWARHPSTGNRAVVDVEAAWRQWGRCVRAGR